MNHRLVAIAVAGVLLLGGGAALLTCCSKTSEAADDHQEHVDLEAEAVSVQECVLCGMTVRDQPGPRGQMVHRDGTRVLFCSISELRDYVNVPSPHGRVAEAWVELLPAGWSPPASDAVAPPGPDRPWLEARRASYVVGVDVKGVMGESILAFADRPAAEAIATAHGGQVVDWGAISSR